MVGQKDRYGALCKIADLKYQTLKLDMAKLREQERGLRQNLLDLAETKRAMPTPSQSGGGFVAAVGVDLRWHQWVDQRRTTINMELAQVMAQQEELRVKLRRAFGKSEVAMALASQAMQRDRQSTLRRAAYES